MDTVDDYMMQKHQSELAKIKKPTIVMEYTGPWNVKITYFKDSGKFYTEGEYISHKLNLWEIWDELKEMFKDKKRPGLVDGRMDFYAVVEVPDHPHNHPVLIFPED